MLLDTKLLEPAIGQSALERNYLEGLKNNQRKGVKTVACALCLPSSRHQEAE